MELGINGKRALVTGASRGIGRSVVKCLAREGVIVSAVARSANEVDHLIKSIGGTEEGHLGVAMDMVPKGAPEELYDKLNAKKFNPIEIVFHNLGGTLNITDPLCSVEDWRDIWRLNMEIALTLNKLLIPKMKEKKWGRIIHNSSIASMENQGPVPYCAVKAALTAYTRSMGRVLAPDGIVMTAVLPGAVFTEGGYWDIASTERPEHVEKYLEDRMAIHRFGKPDEIGNFVVFLCSEQASFCTGSIIPIDGGQGRGFFGQ